VQHHDVNACEESKAVKSREVIRFCFFHIEVIKSFLSHTDWENLTIFLVFKICYSFPF
jgi:hypothetical protein